MHVGESMYSLWWAEPAPLSLSPAPCCTSVTTFFYRKGLRTASATALYAADGIADAEYYGYGNGSLPLSTFTLPVDDKPYTEPLYIKHVGP